MTISRDLDVLEVRLLRSLAASRADLETFARIRIYCQASEKALRELRKVAPTTAEVEEVLRDHVVPALKLLKGK